MTGTVPDHVSSYEDAARWIYERIDYERVPPVRASPHFQLDRVRRQLALIGSPQERIPAVHIAGTKGKGSTAAMVDSILRSSGIRTGLFTSPHIEHFEERMKVDGCQPDQEGLTSLVSQLRELLNTAEDDLKRDPPTYFEVATLLAWMYFDQMDCEIVVLETGLGGRLDCTNVCNPLVTVITNISLDHTPILGNTIEEIAAEKAGIIKHGVPVVLGVDQPAVVALCEATAAECDAEVQRLGRQIHVNIRQTTRSDQVVGIDAGGVLFEDVRLSLMGAHQATNSALAAAAALIVSGLDARVTPSSIRSGLSDTVWPLRFELASREPSVVLDAAHNPASAAAVVETLNNGQWPERPRVLVFGASRDKDIDGMLRTLLPEFDHVVLTSFRQGRSCPVDQMLHLAADLGVEAVAGKDVESALMLALELAGPAGLVCVTGSVFLAAECRVQMYR